MTNVQKRIAMEKRIVKATIAALLASGYSLSVNDGDEITVARSTDAKALLDAMMTTDEDWLLAHNAEGKAIAQVYFVYGNDGYDVINDYSVSLEAALTPVNNLTEQLEREVHGS